MLCAPLPAPPAADPTWLGADRATDGYPVVRVEVTGTLDPRRAAAESTERQPDAEAQRRREKGADHNRSARQRIMPPDELATSATPAFARIAQACAERRPERQTQTTGRSRGTSDTRSRSSPSGT